jgi:uncharacterized RDD family membrane protein YckC
MNWYYVDGQNKKGPITEEQFQELRNSGQIQDGTYVWHEGMADWKACSEIAGALVQEGRAPCAQCRKQFPKSDLLQHESVYVCADCKPAFFQKLQEGAALPGILDYAGFWIRFGAKFIDGIILNIVSWVTQLGLIGVGGAIAVNDEGAASGMAIAAMVGAYAIPMLFQVLYDVFFVGKFGATPGKMACKLRIVRPDGSRLGYGRAFGRHFAEILSGLIFCIGYFMIISDAEKRALHDRLCDTRVVRIS